MKERVSVLKPDFSRPILLIAPHGKDDLKTGELVECLSEELDCCALINWGFEKTLNPDSLKDQADCNKISHCVSEVVLDEYYNEIVKLTGKLSQIHEVIHIFHIHGCQNLKSKDPNKGVHVVGGFGSEQNPSCEHWRKYAFSKIYKKELDQAIIQNTEFCIAKQNGKYSGKSMDNMNQLYSHKIDTFSSIQLEFTPHARNLYKTMTADTLSAVINEYVNIEFDDYFEKDIWSEDSSHFGSIQFI